MALIFALIVAPLCVAGAILLVRELRRAPVGYEDELGFHYSSPLAKPSPYTSQQVSKGRTAFQACTSRLRSRSQSRPPQRVTSEK